MAGMKIDGGLVYVVGGGQYVNIMGEDASGDENLNLVFKNADAFKLGQLLIEQSGLATCNVCGEPFGVICSPDPLHPGYSYCGRKGKQS